ncbi:MAG: hypothetical protein JJE40_00615 [Vicinamibacteria bacterium]|nr:hypothetical protein [Vicinamibacteria bacterium]
MRTIRRLAMPSKSPVHGRSTMLRPLAAGGADVFAGAVCATTSSGNASTSAAILPTIEHAAQSLPGGRLQA